MDKPQLVRKLATELITNAKPERTVGFVHQDVTVVEDTFVILQQAFVSGNATALANNHNVDTMNSIKSVVIAVLSSAKQTVSNASTKNANQDASARKATPGLTDSAYHLRIVLKSAHQMSNTIHAKNDAMKNAVYLTKFVGRNNVLKGVSV